MTNRSGDHHSNAVPNTEVDSPNVARPLQGPLPEDWYDHLVVRRSRGRSCMVDGIDFLDQRKSRELYSENDGHPERHDYLLISRECHLRPAIDQMILGYEAGAHLSVAVDRMESPPSGKELHENLVGALSCLVAESEDWRRGFRISSELGFTNEEPLRVLAEILRKESLDR